MYEIMVNHATVVEILLCIPKCYFGSGTSNITTNRGMPLVLLKIHILQKVTLKTYWDIHVKKNLQSFIF